MVKKTLHGVIPGTGASYDFTFNSAVIVPDEKGNVIRINHLTMGMGSARVADTDAEGEEPASRAAVIKTDIDVREGQKVVVGKANVGVKEKSALILVVTARGVGLVGSQHNRVFCFECPPGPLFSLKNLLSVDESSDLRIYYYLVSLSIT